MALSHVIFDIGNVVVEWDVQKILASLNQPEHIVEELESELFYHQDWLDLDHGLKTETRVTEEICRRSILTPDICARAFLAAKQSLVPIPETIELMHALKARETDMYCLSNMPMETYEFLKHSRFFGLFKGIVISGIEKCMKPDRRIYDLILDRYHIPPSGALFLDDSPANIEAAEKAGIQGVLFDRSPGCYARIRRLLGMET